MTPEEQDLELAAMVKELRERKHRLACLENGLRRWAESLQKAAKNLEGVGFGGHLRVQDAVLNPGEFDHFPSGEQFKERVTEILRERQTIAHLQQKLDL